MVTQKTYRFKSHTNSHTNMYTNTKYVWMVVGLLGGVSRAFVHRAPLSLTPIQRYRVWRPSPTIPIEKIATTVTVEEKESEKDHDLVVTYTTPNPDHRHHPYIVAQSLRPPLPDGSLKPAASPRHDAGSKILLRKGATGPSCVLEQISPLSLDRVYAVIWDIVREERWMVMFRHDAPVQRWVVEKGIVLEGGWCCSIHGRFGHGGPGADAAGVRHGVCLVFQDGRIQEWSFDGETGFRLMTDQSTGLPVLTVVHKNQLMFVGDGVATIRVYTRGSDATVPWVQVGSLDHAGYSVQRIRAFSIQRVNHGFNDQSAMYRLIAMDECARFFVWEIRWFSASPETPPSIQCIWSGGHPPMMLKPYDDPLRHSSVGTVGLSKRLWTCQIDPQKFRIYLQKPVVEDIYSSYIECSLPVSGHGAPLFYTFRSILMVFHGSVVDMFNMDAAIPLLSSEKSDPKGMTPPPVKPGTIRWDRVDGDKVFTRPETNVRADAHVSPYGAQELTQLYKHLTRFMSNGNAFSLYTPYYDGSPSSEN